MAVKRKAQAHNLPVPQSKQDAADQLKRIGDLRRQIDRSEVDMKDALARIKAKAQEALVPVIDELSGLEEGVRMWCESNRDMLTAQGKIKTVDLGTGKIKWRTRPPKISLRGIDKIIEQIQARKLKSFLRTKIEVDKEAMQKDPETANGIKGVSIITGVEDFVIEPFEAEVAR
jgi:phage host-nuclease inhibitor protein Gam